MTLKLDNVENKRDDKRDQLGMTNRNDATNVSATIVHERGSIARIDPLFTKERTYPLSWDTLHDIAQYFVEDTNTQISFMSVCKLWRGVILCTPSFWTSISLLSRYSRIADFEYGTDRIKWLVDRSGELLLHVLWNQSPDLTREFREDIEAFFIHRAPPERWKSLVTNDHGILNLKSLETRKFNSLRVLEYSATPPADGLIRIIKKTAMALSRITITHLNRPPAGVCFPLNLIEPETWLDLPEYGFAMEDCESLFQRVEKLRIVTANFPRTINPTPFSKVKDLHILLCILDLFEFGAMFPNLENLCIQSASQSRRDVSLPKLRVLHLWNDSQELLQCIEAPLLEELYLEGPGSLLTDVLDDPCYQISPQRLILDIEATPTVFFQLLSLSPRLDYIKIVIKYRSGLLEKLFEVLAIERNAAGKGIARVWSCCSGLSHLEISMKSARLLGDVKLLEEPAKALFKERSRDSLKSITLTWTDGSRVHINSQ